MCIRDRVGVLTADPADVLEEGSQITGDHGTVSLGHVTSAYFSATLGRSMALALVSGGRERRNQMLYVPMPDRTIAVRVTDPVFYDPTGARLHG